MRAAIYFTPPAGDPLTRAANRWLGRSAFDGEATRDREPELDDLVASPARYGFHATMKAPFRLTENAELADLDARLASFCASRQPVTINSLVINALGAFFAFVPADTPPALGELEAAVVKGFEPFRAPMTDAEFARRCPERLSERERRNLREWGYPNVFQQFRFHMTLTGPVAAHRYSETEATLRDRFSDFDGEPLTVNALALFVEPEPGAPFKVHSLHSFDGA